MDVYLLNPVINKANGAVSIGGYGGSIAWHIAVVVATAAAAAKGTSSRNVRPLDIST